MIMKLRNLLGWAIVFLCVAGCEKEKKRDDFIINRRDRVVTRYDGNNGETDGYLPSVGADLGLSAECSICFSDGMLVISLMDSGIYDLHIENIGGVVVYASELPADGNVYEFDISAIRKEDLYVLVLNGPGGEIKWYF